MANHHHQNKSMTSGVQADIEFMDIDEIVVVPDTPDRVFNSKQPENINKISTSGDSSLRRNRVFVPSSSSRHVSVSNVVDSKTFKPEDRYHHHHRHDRDHYHHHDHDHYYRKNPIVVEHGGIVKVSPKFKKDDLGARKMGRLFLHPSNITSLNINGASFKSTRSDNNSQMKVKVDHDERNDIVLSQSRNDKGKVKVKVDHDEPVHSSALSIKGDANVCPKSAAFDNEKFSSPPFRVPSNNNHKRLVRNGCISPHNIVNAKKREDKSSIGIETGERVAISEVSRPIIDVNEASSKHNVKGKGLLIDDSSSMGHAGRKSGAENSTNERNKGKFHEDCIIVNNTHDKSNKNGISRNNSPFPSTSSANNKSMLSEVQFRTPSASFRRPKRISGSSGKGKDVIFLSSGGESSSVKPLRNRGGFSERESGSSLARDDVIVEERESITESNNDSEAREIQLQEDEKLARELQEQLYNETPIFTSVERVSSLGREEPEGNSSGAASLPNSHDSVVASSSSSSRLRPPQQSLRARLFRRGSQARLPRSNLSRIRSQLYSYPTGRRGLLSNMDVDMRMHFLESLEAVYNEDISMVNQLLNSDREFGENDYEMLLTLDENNHTHLGASVAQIANLPLSTVNNDNCEICSICLETPVIGDTMRHLPCLHKFHRDCIDLWLRRKRACPICKSDV